MNRDKWGTLMETFRKPGLRPDVLRVFAAGGKIETRNWNGRPLYRVSDALRVSMKFRKVAIVPFGLQDLSQYQDLGIDQKTILENTSVKIFIKYRNKRLTP